MFKAMHFRYHIVGGGIMLSKKKKKLAEFINNTRHIDYKNTTDIIESFNSSIAYFSRFKELLDGGDEEAASRKLRDAGNKLYNSCEWSYKNYLYNKYKELYANGSIKYSECCILCAKLNARDCDLGHLISELNRVANPNPSSAGVDLSQIRGNAYFVNNGPKHSAMIPDPEKYLLSATEIRKFIKHYIDNEALLASSNDSIYGNENAWYEFKQDCDEFDETNSYVLIIGPLTGIRKEDAKKLFAIRWDMVFDFDASSDIDGLAALYRNITGINPVIRDLSRENVRKRINPSSTPYWVMASGYADDLSSISTSKDWRLKYGRNLADFLDKFHAEYTKPAKVIIASFNEDRIIEKIIQDYNVAYNNGEDIDFIALSSESDFARIDEDNFKISSLSLDALLSNLNNITMSNYTSSNSDTIIIPGRDCDKSLEKDFYARLRDSFEVVYKGIELKEVDDPSKNNPEEFYKGATHISWYGLKRHFDIERKDYKHIEKRIKDELDDKGRVIRSLHYEPGVGGTTTMRRLAWELHNENPVLILKEHLGEQTVKSVEKLYNISKLPILILADSNDISAIDARKLHGELKIENFPFLIYYVERKNKYTKPSDIESNGLLINLSEDEAKEMKNVLEPFKFDFSRDEQLERICKNNSEERIPFIMSMYAFDKNFKGVKPYITNFLKYLLPESKKILSYIALADYANENIDTQFFADLFENNEIDSFIFEQDGAFNSLVVLTQKTGNKKYFRIKYPPFAEEILIQLSSGYDGTRIIFSNLLDYILSFIEDSRKNEYSYNHETVELLRTLFITRIEDADSTKPAFSPLIEQLRSECYTYSSSLDDSNDIIARIFKKLVEVYPDEPHFIAHLARYFFYIDKNYEMGIDKINEAITIAETIYSDREDPLLYHMKAMGYSSRITNKYINSIKKHFRNNEEDEMNEEIELLRDDANQAMELFKKVREMGNGIAGYISDVNLCIQIVDMGKYITGSYESAEFLSKNFDSWYMKYVDHACTIFEECKKRATDKDSLLIAETNGNLLQMIDELEDTISIWESYLSNSSAKQKPQIRRMLARAYQKKNNNRVPQKRNQQEIKRIVELMQQNIFEEHNKPENIRIWFDAIRQLKTDKTENVIDDAIVKLNSWVLSTGSIEAYYYRCILKFIKAVEGSTAAEGELPKLFRELKSKSEHMQNRTSIHEWFGREGEGLEKLISASEYRSNRKEEDIKDELHLLTGRISDNYVNDNHAYISLFGIDVFFNPFATGGRIDRSMTKQRVKFGLGFSYDGPRAFNSSIIPATPDDDVNKSDLLGVLEYGRIVKCEVIKNVEYFTKVRIIGFECAGSIHFDNLCNGYAKDNRPPVGRIIEAMVLNKGYDSKTNKETWYLTMNIKEGSDNNYSLTPFQKKLQEILENDK
jgi:DNA polymerase III delta prime subunit